MKTLTVLAAITFLSAIATGQTAPADAIRSAENPAQVLSAYYRAASPGEPDPELLEPYIQRMIDFEMVDLAVGQARALVRAQPENALGWAVLSYDYAEQGKMESALSAIAQAVENGGRGQFTTRLAGQLMAWYDNPQIDKDLISVDLRDRLSRIRQELIDNDTYRLAYEESVEALMEAARFAMTSSPEGAAGQDQQVEIADGAEVQTPARVEYRTATPSALSYYDRGYYAIDRPFGGFLPIFVNVGDSFRHGSKDFRKDHDRRDRRDRDYHDRWRDGRSGRDWRRDRRFEPYHPVNQIIHYQGGRPTGMTYFRDGRLVTDPLPAAGQRTFGSQIELPAQSPTIESNTRAGRITPQFSDRGSRAREPELSHRERLERSRTGNPGPVSETRSPRSIRVRTSSGGSSSGGVRIERMEFQGGKPVE